MCLYYYETLSKIGGKTYVLNISRDITERKKAEEERQALQMKLVAADRLSSIGQLVSGVAHELNNPLTGVIGFSEMLLKHTDIPEAAREDLKIVVEEAKRTVGIVRGLLSFARQPKIDREPTDVNSLIQNVLGLRAYEQKVNKIEVTTRFASGLPEVLVNGSQLQQVFMNIIVNAEQAMIEAHNGGTLTVTTEQIRGVVRISFADDGPGISLENMKKLFTPFFTTKEVDKGTGLGLSICHGIITEHGGRMYAESEPGNGATFIVELPVGKQ